MLAHVSIDDRLESHGSVGVFLHLDHFHFRRPVGLVALGRVQRTFEARRFGRGGFRVGTDSGGRDRVDGAAIAIGW